MAGISSLFSSNTFAQGLAETAQLSARPQMELQINTLQNAVIDRLNQKIKEVKADYSLENDTLDLFLQDSASRLESFGKNTEKYLFDNGRNMLTVDGLMGELSTLNTALQADDTPAFDAALKKINWTVDMLHDSHGFKIGLYVDDGIKQLQGNGLLTFNNSGVSKQAQSRSDFADDAEASSAINSALSELSRLASVLKYNQDAAENLRSTTEKNLKSTLLQIQTTRMANDTEKANEVEKLRQEYSQLLNTISLAFESNVAMAERLSANLFQSAALQPGSVMNLFA